jgi:hypothetical protein
MLKENNRCLQWEFYTTHKYKMQELLNVKAVGTYQPTKKTN